jgi:hypothetical protein
MSELGLNAAEKAAKRAMERIEQEGYISEPPGSLSAYRRAFMETTRVNVGLVAENAELRKKLGLAAK